MAWWNFLTSSDKVVTTATDLAKDAASGIDMLFFTDEEKSQASAKVMESVIAMYAAEKDENSVRSKTRRILAILIFANYAAIINASAVFYCLDSKEKAAALFNLANETLADHVLAVIIFYFGYYGISKIMGGKKK